VHDFTDVPLEVCVERDAARDRTVGEETIRALHQRFLAGHACRCPCPTRRRPPCPYASTRRAGTPKAVLVDIDGTTALITNRSPFDSTRVHQDLPNGPVIDVVRAMQAAGQRVVFLSGRTDDSRAATESWLAKHVGVTYDALYMRPTGDSRKDSIVKIELFDAHVREVYDVTCVLTTATRSWRRGAPSA